MKKQIGLMTLSLMLASPALAGGAGAPAKAPTATACRSIAQLVAANPDLSTLNTAIDAADLTAVLNAAGSYTVFAPSNAAFAKVPSDQLAAALNDPAALRNLLLYHVVAEKATAAQIRGVKGGTTVQGDDIAVSTQGNVLLINNARVTRADLVACNGIVHVIDTVLMPPAAPQPEAAAPAPEPAPAAAAPEPAPAEPGAAPAPPPVVSAPVVIPATPLSGSTISTDTTQQTTTVTDTSADTSTDTSADASADTSADTSMDTSADTSADTSTEVAPAPEIQMETTTSGSAYEVVQQDDRFSTLRDLIASADLGGTLEGMSGEYTIFAPTNDAFANLPEGVLDLLRGNKEALTKVLLYHVVKSKVNAADLAMGTIPTAEGADLDLGAATITSEIEAGASAVYPIDVVLLPTDFVLPDK